MAMGELFNSLESDGQAPKENHAFKLLEKEVLTKEVRQTPVDCGPWDAIVCPKRIGICGSDMHFFNGHFNIPSNGFVLGHETAGVVAQVGDSVRGLKVGDKVAMEPGAGCLRCEMCKSGQYAHCEFMRFAAAQGYDGTLQGYYTLPADLCYKLPDWVSLEEGALMEPLAVAVNAVAKIGKMRPTENVAVFGAGPVGLLVMAVAKALVARRIIAVDINQARLDFARQYAATDIHVADPMMKDEDRETYAQRHARVIKEKFGLSDRGSTGIDIVFECSGAEPSVQTGCLILKRRGKFISVGNGAMFMSVPMRMVTNQELTIKGSFRYGPGIYTMAMDLVSRGLLDLKPLLTHRFTFNDTRTAFDTVQKGRGPDGKIAIKVMIEGPI